MSNYFSRAFNFMRQNIGRTSMVVGGAIALGGLGYMGYQRYRQYRRAQMGPIGPMNNITPQMLQTAGANLRRTDYGIASARYDKMHIRRDVGQSPTQFVDFMQSTRSALAKLDSRPVGRQMLTDLNAGNRPDLDIANNDLVETNVHFRQYATNSNRYNPENFLPNDDEAHRFNGVSGAGNVTSRVRWNPNLLVSDGHRPAFIGLGHELVHAWRGMTGNAVRRDALNTGPAINRRLNPLLSLRDEFETVGLHATPRHLNAPTENALRGEHGIAPRPVYSGTTTAQHRQAIANTYYSFENLRAGSGRAIAQRLLRQIR